MRGGKRLNETQSQVTQAMDLQCRQHSKVQQLLWVQGYPCLLKAKGGGQTFKYMRGGLEFKSPAVPPYWYCTVHLSLNHSMAFQEPTVGFFWMPAPVAGGHVHGVALSVQSAVPSTDVQGGGQSVRHRWGDGGLVQA